MFPFVGLMKLAFISCFLIAVGVSVAIVINPLSNELQGAWIVSIMGTGAYSIYYPQIVLPNSPVHLFYFSFSSLCAVIFWYFAAVMYSLYKSMKIVDENKPHMVSELNNEHAMGENVV